MTPYWPFYAGAVAYAVFILVCIVVGFSKSKTPIIDFCLRHLLFSPFVALALYWQRGLPAAFFGSFYFWLFHYGAGFHLFGVAQRSVSTNILIFLLKKLGSANLDQVKREYGGSKSLSFVTDSRLAQMEKWKWIQSDSANVKVSPKGRKFGMVSDFILNLFSLRPLGSS